MHLILSHEPCIINRKRTLNDFSFFIYLFELMCRNIYLWKLAIKKINQVFCFRGFKQLSAIKCYKQSVFLLLLSEKFF